MYWYPDKLIFLKKGVQYQKRALMQYMGNKALVRLHKAPHHICPITLMSILLSVNPCHAEEFMMPCPHLIFSQSYLIQVVDTNSQTYWQTMQIQISYLLQTNWSGSRLFEKCSMNGQKCGPSSETTFCMSDLGLQCLLKALSPNIKGI